MRHETDGISVLVLSSTLLGRLRLALRLALPKLTPVAVVCAVVAALPIVVPLAFPETREVWEGRRLEVYLGFWLVLTAAFGGPLFVARLYQARDPSPLEAALPRRVTFREHSLLVVEPDGTAREVGWSWIAGARDRGDHIVLQLARDATVELTLPARIFSKGSLEVLRQWLTANRLLPARADAAGSSGAGDGERRRTVQRA